MGDHHGDLIVEKITFHGVTVWIPKLSDLNLGQDPI